jgi:hypothetical protein
MGNLFRKYDTPEEYPLCTEKHDLFKGPEDDKNETYIRKLINNGDLEYINILRNRYKFDVLDYNCLAFIRDVTSGWTKWNFPVEPEKANITIYFLQLVNNYSYRSYADYLNCEYINDEFHTLISCLEKKKPMDFHFIQTAVNLVIYRKQNNNNNMFISRRLDEFFKKFKIYVDSLHLLNNEKNIQKYNEIEKYCKFWVDYYATVDDMIDVQRECRSVFERDPDSYSNRRVDDDDDYEEHYRYHHSDDRDD